MSRPSLVLLAVLALVSGCATPPPPAPVRRAPAKKTLTEAQVKTNKQEFFLAVRAYAEGDLVLAKEKIDGILKTDPADPDALAMRQRLLAVERASAK